MDDAIEVSEQLGPMFNAIFADTSTAISALGLGPGAAVLDVGTGAGNCAISLALKGLDVLTGEPASDTSHYAGREWAENAEKAGVRDKIRFEAFDAGDMPYAPKTFDAVFFFGVLHHVDEPQRADVFRESLRVVKDGGAVVFFEPTEQTLKLSRKNDPGHPDAADPSLYAARCNVTETRLKGDIMDIYIYRNAV